MLKVAAKKLKLEHMVIEKGNFKEPQAETGLAVSGGNKERPFFFFFENDECDLAVFLFCLCCIFRSRFSGSVCLFVYSFVCLFVCFPVFL